MCHSSKHSLFQTTRKSGGCHNDYALPGAAGMMSLFFLAARGAMLNASGIGNFGLKITSQQPVWEKEK